MEFSGSSQAVEQLGRQVGLWRWDLATQEIACSDRLLEILGFTRDTIATTPEAFVDLVHPDSRDRIWSDIEARIADRGTFDGVYPIRHADGHYVTVRTQASVICDAEGRPTGMIGTTLDITEEIEARLRLEETETRFRDLAKNIPGAIFRYLRHPDGSDSIEYMSPGCENIWEHSAEEIQGDPQMLWSMALKEDLPLLTNSVRRSAESLTPWFCTWRVRTRAGCVKWLEGRGQPSLLADGTILWNSLVLDVTEAQETRQELQKKTEMLSHVQKMEAIGRIAGGIAHDFNNLLAIIMGNAELLDLDEDDSGNILSREEILQACSKGSELTRRMLSFARQSHLEPTLTNINDVVRSMNNMLVRSVPENIEIETSLMANLWSTELDVSFLESSLLNLVINARDAMRSGGKLTIETGNFRVTEDYLIQRGESLAPGRYVMLAVTDTGIGIPAHMIDKVIEPFVTTKGPQMGSGLGLAMVDGFTRQSGGAMRIYSEVGRGTSVKLYLPALEARQIGRADEDIRSPTDETPLEGRLLVVEDEAAVRRVIAQALRRAGLTVVEAATGDTALRLFEAEGGKFDMLLTDVVMPGTLQGPALARALVARKPELPVVFISGYPNEAAVHGNGLRPDDRFLMKPVQRHELIALVRSVLGAD